jgi:hypothetical protein
VHESPRGKVITITHQGHGTGTASIRATQTHVPCDTATCCEPISLLKKHKRRNFLGSSP